MARMTIECESCDSEVSECETLTYKGHECRFCKFCAVGIYDDQSIYLSKLVRIMGGMMNELARRLDDGKKPAKGKAKR